MTVKPKKTSWTRYATQEELAAMEVERNAKKWLLERLNRRQARIDAIKSRCVRRAKGLEAAE